MVADLKWSLAVPFPKHIPRATSHSSKPVCATWPSKSKTSVCLVSPSSLPSMFSPLMPWKKYPLSNPLLWSMEHRRLCQRGTLSWVGLVRLTWHMQCMNFARRKCRRSRYSTNWIFQWRRKSARLPVTCTAHGTLYCRMPPLVSSRRSRVLVYLHSPSAWLKHICHFLRTLQRKVYRLILLLKSVKSVLPSVLVSCIQFVVPCPSSQGCLPVPLLMILI